MNPAPPVASVEQFKSALLALRDRYLPPSHRAMLQAQCRASGSAITATQLAAAADYENYNAANLQYATLAFNVAGLLGFTPSLKRQNGDPCWWTTLSVEGEAPDDGEPHFYFVMHSELIHALRKMRWA